MAYRSNLGYVDAEAIESNAVNAGIKAGQNAVVSYSPSSASVFSEEDVFYAGFVEGYNSYMESINSQIFIGLAEARKKVTYQKTKVTPNETIQHEAQGLGPGSAQQGSSGINIDTELKWSGVSLYDYMDGGSSSGDTATITVNATGEKKTISTKKAGINPLLVAAGFGAVLLILLVTKK